MQSKPRRIEIRNQTRDTLVCAGARLADTFTLRLFGLLGETSLTEEDGLLIAPSSGVHTFGMRFAIDIVALDRRNRVVGLWHETGPWKIKGLSRRTKRVLELPPGRIRRCGLAVGDELVVAGAGN